MRKLIKKILKLKIILLNFFKSDLFLNWLVFTFIFTVYFCSSVGLINSGDTIQYFTAEAILKYGSIDISFLKMILTILFILIYIIKIIKH